MMRTISRVSLFATAVVLSQSASAETPSLADVGLMDAPLIPHFKTCYANKIRAATGCHTQSFNGGMECPCMAKVLPVGMTYMKACGMQDVEALRVELFSQAIYARWCDSFLIPIGDGGLPTTMFGQLHGAAMPENREQLLSSSSWIPWAFCGMVMAAILTMCHVLRVARTRTVTFPAALLG